jgi:hypothetical protein
LFCVAVNKLNQIITEEDNYQSTLRLRQLIETAPIYDRTPIFTSVRKEMQMDFSRMLEKPFHLMTVPWPASLTAGTFFGTIGFPSALLSLNKLASAAFDLASLYHLRACFIIQVAGTPMHAGALLASVTPVPIPFVNVGEAGTVHQFQVAPHVYLHASDANAVCVEIPWFSPTKLRLTPSDNDAQDEWGISLNTSASSLNRNSDYAELDFYVLSSLGVPTGGVVSVNITVAVKFLEMNFFVPKATYVSQSKVVKGAASLVTHGLDSFAQAAKAFTGDIVDSARFWLRDLTGLHNPNIRNPSMRGIMAMRNNPNYVDKETYYYKLDPYSQHVTPMLEYESDTMEDEGLILNMCKKKMLVSTFAVSTSTAVGTTLFSAPIHPLMFRGVAVGGSTAVVSSPIEKLTRMAKFWSGSLKLTIHNFGSAFHMFKLLVTREYFGSYQMSTSGLPLMTSVLNNPTDILEFSNGGQTYEIDLPMASVFDHIPISCDYITNDMIHGRVMIYLLQPMVTNGAVVTSINVGVHLSAQDDFCLYGYAGDYLTSQVETFPALASQYVTQSAVAPVLVSDSGDVANHAIKNEIKPRMTDFRPFVHIRDVCRRMIPFPPITVSAAEIITNQGVRTIDIANVLFSQVPSRNALQTVASMFYGFRGGLKVKVLIKGCSDAVISYLPPLPYMVDLGSTSSNNNQYRLGVGQVVNSPYAPILAEQYDRLSAFRFQDSVYNGPILETLDYRDPHTALDQVGTSNTGPTSSDTNAALCQAEFEIPWMNSCRFISTLNSVVGVTGQPYESYSNSLGHIAIGANTMYVNNIDDGVDAQYNYRIYLFIGFDDTARFLYQVASAPLYLPSPDIDEGTPFLLDSNWSSPLGINPSSLPTPSGFPNYTIGAASI